MSREPAPFSVPKNPSVPHSTGAVPPGWVGSQSLRFATWIPPTSGSMRVDAEARERVALGGRAARRSECRAPRAARPRPAPARSSASSRARRRGSSAPASSCRRAPGSRSRRLRRPGSARGRDGLRRASRRGRQRRPRAPVRRPADVSRARESTAWMPVESPQQRTCVIALPPRRRRGDSRSASSPCQEPSLGLLSPLLASPRSGMGPAQHG